MRSFALPRRAAISATAAALLGLLGACNAAEPAAPAPAADPGAAPAVTATPLDAEGRFLVNPRLLPAHRVNPTKATLKADEFDNERAANPQHFAITVPPANIAHVRPMVEWEPMRAITMSYPGYMLTSANATATFVSIAQHASEHGEVWFLVDGNQAENGLTSRILAAGVPPERLGSTIRFLHAPLDSVWFIDAGPLPLVDTQANTFAFADFRYYHERPLDDALPTVLARNLAGFGYEATTSVYRAPLTVEGGTFQSTTDGICFTGDRELYNLSCYDGACDEGIEALTLAQLQTHPFADAMRATLAQYVGCKDLVVLHSITDDGTGHIDMYLKVLDDHRVLIGKYEAPFSGQQATNAARLDDDAAFIEAYVKPDGSRFTAPRIIMPGSRNSSFGRVPFTYVNSTFFNGLNLWPAYPSYSDWNASRDAAEATWNEVLPDMEHIYVDATELSFYSGAIHCVTRTIPAIEAGDWVADGTCGGAECAAPAGGYDGVCVPGDDGLEACWGPAWQCDCNDCSTGCEVAADPCGGIPFAGCCDGSTLYYCEQQRVYSQACQGGCGWDGSSGWYDCSFSGVDPSGHAPRDCPGACEPSCEGRFCGDDDGCGGTCTTCTGGGVCTDGVCVGACDSCTPGTSGCDGDTAWTCAEETSGCPRLALTACDESGLTCVSGACVERRVEPEPDTVDSDTRETTPDATSSPDGATAGPDATSADDGAGGGDIGVGGDTSGQAFTSRKSSGCAGGGEAGGGPLAGLLGVLALAATRRRRTSV
ncbi:MAG: agmatine deiminase family protein [Deltaproteobacteria bacterium]|nr:agmatine deiminase family protein [Deltaproteobacteria bacterium]